MTYLYIPAHNIFMPLPKKTKDEIYKNALLNAVSYKGKANVGAVASKLFGSSPELRKNAKEVMQEINIIVKEINSLTPEQQKEKIEKLGVKTQKKKKAVEKTCLPPLPKAKKGKVVMRFAPNPNGPPTLGSSRGIILNNEYVKKYKGKFILRFDDTDPATKKPILEAYEWYKEDMKWLGIKPDKVIVASERIKKYYMYAEKLIKLDNAYVCFCKQEDFKKLRDRRKPCPHRNAPVKDNLVYWGNMIDGKYADKEAVLRIKTDIKNRNPALRDWVAFRIIRAKHPRIGKKHIVWPMLDFESAIEDHLLKITHILRGIDLMDSEKRQKFIYDYFKWKYPATLHFGRVAMEEFGKISTSSIKEGIEQKKYTGWDDPRLPTIRALKRRGFQKDAIKNFWLSIGLSESFIRASVKSLEAENRKIIEPASNRYFFIHNPVEIKIKNAPKEAKLPLHPNFPKKGCRKLKVKDSILISKNDLELAKNEARLMDLCNIKIKGETAEVTGQELKKNIPIIHWLPKESNIPTKIIMPDGSVKDGLSEINCKNLKENQTIQFVRFGFCRVDKTAKKDLVLYFTHK